MLRFYYDPKYKYSNRTLIDVSSDAYYRDIDYENIDSADTINGHIIYSLETGEKVPTYIIDLSNDRRYYVTGITQLRTDKFQISVIRDVISESLDWSKERAYISAGTATDYCKYKIWGLPFTNTKVKEERLNINGKSSFFVFYTNQVNNSSGTLTEDDLVLKYESTPTSTTAQASFESLGEIPGYEYIGQRLAFKTKLESETLLYPQGGITQDIPGPDALKTYHLVNKLEARYDGKYKFVRDTITSVVTHILDYSTGTTSYISTHPALYCNKNAVNKITFSNAKDVLYNETIKEYNRINESPITGEAYPTINLTVLNNLDSLVDKVIRVKNSIDSSIYDYYIVRKKYNNLEEYSFYEPLNSVASKNLISGLVKEFNLQSGDIANMGQPFLKFNIGEEVREYELENIGAGAKCNFNLKADVSKLPKSNVRCVNIVSDGVISDQLIMRSLMLCQTNPDASDENIGRIIDVQYLPFSVATTTNSNIKFGNINATAEFLSIDDFIYETNLDDLENIHKETDSIIIVSPSRKSQYKFRPYNNDGNMEFSTRITLKPYQSVIYVRPSTKGLLMRDWNDKDCLIIQEDFSLTSTTSLWAEYVYNNRNYQNAFNLDIQTKEFERGWERRIEQAQKKADNWNARNVSSEKVKMITGNQMGTSNIFGALGAAIKDPLYLQAAALDRQYNEATYQRTIEVANQTFEYQIENVKSQPLIPNTITAIDVKMLDGIYLEYYSTNDTELESINNYYVYNGNRIDNYGTFSDYWGQFVRGNIIISQKYTQPELDEINRRLELGIFTGGIV